MFNGVPLSLINFCIHLNHYAKTYFSYFCFSCTVVLLVICNSLSTYDIVPNIMFYTVDSMWAYYTDSAVSFDDRCTLHNHVCSRYRHVWLQSVDPLACLA